MPTWVITSPAVVMVWTPERKFTSPSGAATGPQRNCPRLSEWSPRHGAVFQSASASAVKRRVWRTLGRIRYSQERSLEPRGAVKGEPDNCSA